MGVVHQTGQDGIGQDVVSDGGSPLLLAMTRGHVARPGLHARSVGPWMAGDLLPAEIELDEMLTGMQLDLLTDVLVRDRVAVLVDFDVVVDVDLAATDIDILVGVLRWRFKRGFIQRVAAAGATYAATQVIRFHYLR